MNGSTPYGYAIDGPSQPMGDDGDAVRLHVKAADAFALACSNEVLYRTGESYLSAFDFPPDWLRHCKATIAAGNRYGGTEGYEGQTCSRWLWWDLDDKQEPLRAIHGGAQLALYLLDRYELDADDVLAFASGGKGLHLGLPAALFAPVADVLHHRRAETYAVALAESAAVPTDLLDRSIYDRSRAFRAPNSRHRKTGRYKVRLPADRLGQLSAEAIDRLAAHPHAFDLPDTPELHPNAVADWGDACRRVAETRPSRTSGSPSPSTVKGRITDRTWDAIRFGLKEGDRHHGLYLIALNMAEYESVEELSAALIARLGHDCGTDDAESYAQQVARRAAARTDRIT